MLLVGAPMTDSRYDALSQDATASGVGRIHFVGIGGAGMSVLAQMFHELGAEVTGSDAHESDVVLALRALGIAVSVPQHERNVTGADVVAISSAIRDTNPEFMRAKELGLPVIHRSQALALLMSDRRAVAVAGAHGKTTTSAMIAVSAMECGLEPSYAIGGSVRTATGAVAGGQIGAGDVLVAEADESDGSFLNYRPYIAVVTNVEPDHLDHYGTKEAFEEAFVKFAGQVVDGGALVACGDDEGSQRLAHARSAQGARVVTYGFGQDNTIRLAQFAQAEGATGASFTLTWDDIPAADGVIAGGTQRIALKVPGVHNALNASAAFGTMLLLGATPQAAAAGLEAFLGTGRRFEERGQVDNIRVVDDYAHHPTEVAALLNAARVSAGDGRVGVLFQPHLYSRTRIFQQEFAQAFDLADFTIITGVYAAREDLDPAVTGHLIADRMTAYVEVVDDKVLAAHRIAELAEPGDLILTVGAGDVTELGSVILADLQGVTKA